MPTVVFLFLRISLAVRDLLWVCVIFRKFCSVSVKKYPWGFDSDYLEL